MHGSEGFSVGNQGDERRTRDKYGTQHNRWHIALVALCSDVTVHVLCLNSLRSNMLVKLKESYTTVSKLNAKMLKYF